MKIVTSQKAALEAARSALSTQQYDLGKELKELLSTLDTYAEGQEVPEWLTSSIKNRKERLAEAVIARDALYDIEYAGLKEAPKSV